MNKEIYAIKEISKSRLINYREIYSHLNEPNILKEISNLDFVSNIISSFQDDDNLYLVTNYFQGNTLSFYKDEIFNEEQIKFISACIIQSFSYLREKKIIHRDLRMENLVLDKDNYLNLIDFSYSIKYSQKNDQKNYLIGFLTDTAPEIQKESKYDYNSDYYRIGNIIYYLLFKKFVNVIKIEKNITEFYVNYKNNSKYSFSCIDFINKLIINDYRKRLGFKNINELVNHSFFNNYNWNDLKNKKINSPLIFKKNSSESFSCTKIKFYNKNEFNNIIQKGKYKKLLKNFNYINDLIIKNFKRK